MLVLLQFNDYYIQSYFTIKSYRNMLYMDDILAQNSLLRQYVQELEQQNKQQHQQIEQLQRHLQQSNPEFTNNGHQKKEDIIPKKINNKQQKYEQKRKNFFFLCRKYKHQQNKQQSEEFQRKEVIYQSKNRLKSQQKNKSSCLSKQMIGCNHIQLPKYNLQHYQNQRLSIRIDELSNQLEYFIEENSKWRKLVQEQQIQIDRLHAELESLNTQNQKFNKNREQFLNQQKDYKWKNNQLKISSTQPPQENTEDQNFQQIIDNVQNQLFSKNCIFQNLNSQIYELQHKIIDLEEENYRQQKQYKKQIQSNKNQRQVVKNSYEKHITTILYEIEKYQSTIQTIKQQNNLKNEEIQIFKNMIKEYQTVNEKLIQDLFERQNQYKALQIENLGLKKAYQNCLIRQQRMTIFSRQNHQHYNNLQTKKTPQKIKQHIQILQKELKERKKSQQNAHQATKKPQSNMQNHFKQDNFQLTIQLPHVIDKEYQLKKRNDSHLPITPKNLNLLQVESLNKVQFVHSHQKNQNKFHQKQRSIHSNIKQSQNCMNRLSLKSYFSSKSFAKKTPARYKTEKSHERWESEEFKKEKQRESYQPTPICMNFGQNNKFNEQYKRIKQFIKTCNSLQHQKKKQVHHSKSMKNKWANIHSKITCLKQQNKELKKKLLI